jgi:hypothetical protein
VGTTRPRAGGGTNADDAPHAHMMKFADVLADGTAKQFPSKVHG